MTNALMFVLAGMTACSALLLLGLSRLSRRFDARHEAVLDAAAAGRADPIAQVDLELFGPMIDQLRAEMREDVRVEIARALDEDAVAAVEAGSSQSQQVLKLDDEIEASIEADPAETETARG